MKIVIHIFFTFTLISCNQTELLYTTAEDLKEKITSLKGNKAVLLNVWALWCKPCVDEFPTIVNLQKEYEDLEIIFVSADFEDQFNDVLNFLNYYNVGSVSYMKMQKDEPFIKGLHQKWSGSLPFTIVYGKNNGSIVDYWEGKESNLRFINAVSLAIDL